MTKRLLVGLLFCLSLSIFALPTLAQPYRDFGDDPLVKLQKAGWKIVQDGVLQRQPRTSVTETFVFGVQGFTWKLRDLRSQLTVLRREFKTSPTPELRRAIASHRKAIASTLQMLDRARFGEMIGAPILPKTDCTISFAYTANASYKTDRQGTWADASADFSVASGCGFSGEVYAYAFAKTTVGGAPTTATVTDGPRSGSTVNASADANRNGGAPCESYAFASVTSNNLNPTSYSVSQSNELCPEPEIIIGGCSPCTTYSDGSQCCNYCACSTQWPPLECTDHVCPSPEAESFNQ
jgi:hypothetical protein